jgi:hypothetical protein
MTCIHFVERHIPGETLSLRCSTCQVYVSATVLGFHPGLHHSTKCLKLDSSDNNLRASS